MASERPEVDKELVKALARSAELPLPPEQVESATAVLSAWLPDANDLNRKMSEPEHWTVTPATVFTHPSEKEDVT